MAYGSFEDLEVWKRSCRMAVSVYDLFKECRDFGLRDQINRSALSVPSNIAEGAERDSKTEFIRFLHIAKGSAAELRTQIYIAERIGALTSTNKNALVRDLKEISSMLQGLINHLKTAKPS